MGVWFPGANRTHLAPEDGGSIVYGEPKVLWHDTETNGLPSYSDGYHPHLTVVRGEPYQHIPVNRAARSLRHPKGTPHTNRANVIQVEVVGWVNKVVYHKTLRDIALWANEYHGVPLVRAKTWLPYDASYGDSPARMSWSEWAEFSGHCGHMHCPGNVHGDPGCPFPIDYIIARDDMTTEELVEFCERYLLPHVQEGTNNSLFKTGATDARELASEVKQLKLRLSALESGVSAPDGTVVGTFTGRFTP